MAEERKTLTLKRPAPKADVNEPAADVIKTPASLSAPGTVTVRKGKKTIVNVTQPPKWKKKKPTAPPPVAKKEKLKPAPKPKPAPVAKVPKKVKPPRSPRRVTLEYAIAQLAPHWPELFNPRGLKLMAIGLQAQLLQDIQTRNLPLSNKVARRCLHAVSHSPEYLSLMVAGMPRYGLNGEEQGIVTKAEQAYAFDKMSEIWQLRVKAPILSEVPHE
ncbi:MAG: ProQ/FINO family protein [Hafnia sp.]|uniref:ProQ/FINO family protein n=1 Tax=Hafnia sp. TaxID=1873498 RepID=UPI002FC6A728